MRNGSRTKLGLLLVVLAVGGATVTGCRRGGENTAAKVAPASQEKAAIQVRVTPAKREAISQTIEVTGALNALRDVTVGIKSNGKIVAVYFREGDTVRAGQVVAQQDTSDLQAQLDSIIAQQNQAKANLAVAQSKLEQSRVTYKNAQTT